MRLKLERTPPRLDTSAPSLIENTPSFAGLRKTVRICSASRRSAIGKLSPAIVMDQVDASFPDRRSTDRRLNLSLYWLAESIYRAAVASGIMERVAYKDTIAEAG